MADSAGMEIAPDEELRARLVQAADNADLPQLAHQALRLRRTSIALTQADGPGCGGTRFGGLPPLPSEVDWPALDGRPLPLLAQLDCAALQPLLGDDWPFPREGLLLFFSDDTFADFDGTGAHVLHVTGNAPERPSPPDTTVIPPLPLAAARTPSLPSSTSAAIDTLLGDHDLVAAMDAVEALHEVLPRVDYRVLGWHDGGGDGTEGDRPLLQLEGVDGTDWGEIVNVSFWISDEDLASGRLDRVTRAIEVA